MFSPHRLLSIDRTTLAVFTVVAVLGASEKSWGQSAPISSAASVRLYRAHQLIMDNVGYYLEGAVVVDVESGSVAWNASERDVVRTLGEVIWHAASLQRMEGLVAEVTLSEETEALIQRVSNLTVHDLRHWRMANGLTEAEQWYVMVQTSLDELRMQVGMDLNVYLNQTLMNALQPHSVEIPLQNAVNSEWLEIDEGVPLPALSWDASDATSSALSPADESSWVGGAEGDLTAILNRILELLERQDRRLSRLESEESGASYAQVPAEFEGGALRLPESLDVTFYSGSARLTLGAQLQLNEIIELMGRYRTMRVVCTGHADLPGDRQSNLALSRRRAETVRTYLLQSGIAPERALLNFFGEERASATGPADRRVEVRFFFN